ncbi:hypothetical protein [Photorhabdus sp. CRCIA-P01]|nr:hypothetical protein [Photorhabdus sp. CRCIA-P01]
MFIDIRGNMSFFGTEIKIRFGFGISQFNFAINISRFSRDGLWQLG